MKFSKTCTYSLLILMLFLGEAVAKNKRRNQRRDFDRDGVPNSRDCAPRNKRLQKWYRLYVDKDQDGYHDSEKAKRYCLPKNKIPKQYLRQKGIALDCNPNSKLEFQYLNYAARVLPNNETIIGNGKICTGSKLPSGYFAKVPERKDKPCEDNIVHGSIQQRIRYLKTSAISPEQCLSEKQTRECNNGQFSKWSGSYFAKSCEQKNAYESAILFDAHGEYGQKSVKAIIQTNEYVIFETNNEIKKLDLLTGEIKPFNLLLDHNPSIELNSKQIGNKKVIGQKTFFFASINQKPSLLSFDSHSLKFRLELEEKIHHSEPNQPDFYAKSLWLGNIGESTVFKLKGEKSPIHLYDSNNNFLSIKDNQNELITSIKYAQIIDEDKVFIHGKTSNDTIWKYYIFQQSDQSVHTIDAQTGPDGYNWNYGKIKEIVKVNDRLFWKDNFTTYTSQQVPRAAQSLVTINITQKRFDDAVELASNQYIQFIFGLENDVYYRQDSEFYKFNTDIWLAERIELDPQYLSLIASTKNQQRILFFRYDYNSNNLKAIEVMSKNELGEINMDTLFSVNGRDELRELGKTENDIYYYAKKDGMEYLLTFDLVTGELSQKILSQENHRIYGIKFSKEQGLLLISYTNLLTNKQKGVIYHIEKDLALYDSSNDETLSEAIIVSFMSHGENVVFVSAYLNSETRYENFYLKINLHK